MSGTISTAHSRKPAATSPTRRHTERRGRSKEVAGPGCSAVEVPDTTPMVTHPVRRSRPARTRPGTGRGRHPSATPAQRVREPGCPASPRTRSPAARWGLGRRGDRHVVRGTLAGHVGRGLVVADDDHHQVRVPGGLDEQGQRPDRVGDRLCVLPLGNRRVRDHLGGTRLTRGHGGEHRPVSQLVRRQQPRQRCPRGVAGYEVDLGHHGRTTAGTRQLPGGEGVQGELVRHRSIAERRARVPEVSRVVDRVAPVERARRREVEVVGRVDEHGAPASTLERRRQRGPAARRGSRSAAGCQPTPRTGWWRGPAS